MPSSSAGSSTKHAAASATAADRKRVPKVRESTGELFGLLLLDKPAGLSSNRALQRLKRLVGADKAGHAGSLDPLATGMLPIFFGAATRLTSYLLTARKTYRVTATLGTATVTGVAPSLRTASTAERIEAPVARPSSTRITEQS